MPEPSVPAARRSAWSRRGASTYDWRDVPGGAIGAAWSSALAGVPAAAGEPVAVPMAAKLANAGEVTTPEMLCRSALSCCGLARCAWGPVLSLQAATTSAAAAARPRQGRPCRAGMLLLRNVSGLGAAGQSRGACSKLEPTPYPVDRAVN